MPIYTLLFNSVAWKKPIHMHVTQWACRSVVLCYFIKWLKSLRNVAYNYVDDMPIGMPGWKWLIPFSALTFGWHWSLQPSSGMAMVWLCSDKRHGWSERRLNDLPSRQRVHHCICSIMKVKDCLPFYLQGKKIRLPPYFSPFHRRRHAPQCNW